MARDPVCGAEVDETKTKFTSTYKGRTYYFHDEECKTKFDNTINSLKKAGGGICYGVRIEEEKAMKE